MPFEIIDTLDPLTPMIEFRPSSIYEMIISIRALLGLSPKQEAWAKRAASMLAPDLHDELLFLYLNFGEGSVYFELPVDYGDQMDVPGFLTYVRRLSDVDFIFYLVGRTISRKDLAKLIPNGDKIRAALTEASAAMLHEGDHYTDFEWYGRHLDPVLSNISGFRERLVDAWQAYWETFFRQEVQEFEPTWNAGIQEKKSILSREGGRALLERVTGKGQTSRELPTGMPITSIRFVPVCLLPSRVYRFYGYGNETVLFDPQYTEEQKLAVERAKDESMAALKALNDDTRLEILRLIAQHHKGYPHGKIIAEKLGISASAVSRHLALLKEGNLIAEEPLKNLITYRFKSDTLAELADKLLNYLYS